MILRNEIPSKWIRGYGIGWNAITLIKEIVFSLNCAQCNKRIYRLTKFLGQGLGSVQPISRWFSLWKLVHRSRFPMCILWYGYLLCEMCLSWTSTLHLVLGWYLLIRQGFISNLIIYLRKHNHVLDMVILFPPSTPIMIPFYFLHQLP
jgi:hypothetical protein